MIYSSLQANSKAKCPVEIGDIQYIILTYQLVISLGSAPPDQNAFESCDKGLSKTHPWLS